MNQLEIEDYLDKLAKQTEKDIEAVFNGRLRTILNQLAQMYEKYSDKDGTISWTDANKYQRLAKELERISDELTGGYKEIVKTLQESTEYIYLEGYLRHMYLYEGFTGQSMKVTLPSMETIRTILLNPIVHLTLPQIFEPHRNELVRRINISISQGIQAGEGYSTIAKRVKEATGFSKHKATTVVRTEASRARSISALKAEEQATKHANITKKWLSALDNRVRVSHRKLDGTNADKFGYFHYGPNKALGPSLWIGPDSAKLSINCRCQTMNLVNNQVPQLRRGRDYRDAQYQQRLADRIDKYMEDGLTYKQAFKRADKEIQPPSVVIDYVTYDEWKEKFA